MEIRNNAEALKTFLGISSPASTQAPQIRSNENAAAQAAAFGGDQATLSHAGTEVSQSATQVGIRTDKVSAIQEALAGGTYNIQASVVAGKMIDAMLGGGFGTGH
jgi:flagellar biosynthesis anti-sigma factor FlgM